MGSCQLLTLRSLAQFPAEPPAGREAANIWRTFLQKSHCRAGLGGGRAALVRTSGREGGYSPRPSGLFSSAFLAAPSPQPQPPAPSPQPSSPSRLRLAEPRSLTASPRQRAPSICRKTSPFSVPLEHLQASAGCPTPILSMKNRGQDRRGAEPNSKPATSPGIAPTEGGTAAPAQAPRTPDPAQYRAWPGKE